MAAFCLLALKFQLTALDGTPHQVIANSDSGNVAGFIAGWLHPERFADDLVLDDRAKFGFYVTLIIPLVMLIDVFVADLGRSFVMLLFPIVAIQAAGFFLLGRRLGLQRPIAAVLAFVSLTPIWLLPGEFWGVMNVPVVRMAYGALFPFIVLVALRCPLRPQSLIGCAGLCVLGLYLHPVSGPSVAAAVYLALLFAKDPRLSWRRWLRPLVISATLFLILILPFAVVYLGHAPAESPLTVSAPGLGEQSVYGDVGVALGTLIDGPCCNPHEAWGWRWLVWGTGLTGLLWGAVVRGPRASPCRYLLGLSASLLLFSVGIAYLDQAIAAFRGRTPVQLDLVRNLRYVAPLLLIGLFVAIQQLDEFMRRRVRHRGLSGAASGLALIMSVVFTLPYFAKTTPGFLDGTLTPPASFHQSQTAAQIQAALEQLSQQPAPLSVLALTKLETSLAVRYAALQGVSYTDKDLNALLYSSHGDLARWHTINANLQDLETVTDEASARAALCRALDATQPDLVLVDRLATSWFTLTAVDATLVETVRFGDFVRSYRTDGRCKRISHGQ